LLQNFEGDGTARFVVLGAITAGEIAAANNNHLRQERAVAKAGKKGRLVIRIGPDGRAA
jgi:hypothetical protein